MEYIDKIHEYIQKMNNGYVPKRVDKREKFSNNGLIDRFWSYNEEKIIKILNDDPKYVNGYEKAKEIVKEKQYESHMRKSMLTNEQKIEEFIEKINNGYQPKKVDKREKFSNGDLVNSFWSNNKAKIVKILNNNQKYAIGYETAKLIIKKKQQESEKYKSTLKHEQKIEEFIECLSSGYEPINLEKEKHFSNGDLFNYFWSDNKLKIVETINNNQKYKIGYETAKVIIKKKQQESEKYKNTLLTHDQKIEEFIECLNSGYIPINIEKGKYFSNGDLFNYFWSDNKLKIIETLNNNQKYTIGYETAKKIIIAKQLKSSLTHDQKIEEFIEKLNNGYHPKKVDKKEKFSNGECVNYFWDGNKIKIVETINNNSKYKIGYEKAKKMIKITNCISSLKRKSKTRKKEEYDISNMLKEFDVDLETLNMYLCRVNKIQYCPKRTVLMKDDETLKSYCIRNGYNYDVIVKAISMHKFCPNDTLEQLINRSITSYTVKGQKEPSAWIYQKYNILIKHILLYLGVDSTSVLKNMTDNVISLEEAIRHDIFRLNVKEKENWWLEELYNYIIEEIDCNKEKSATEQDIAEMIYILVKEYNLDENELNIIWNILKKYVNTIKLYEKVDVGLETNYEHKLRKIKEYNMDEYDIEESFFIPLEFDNKVLIGKKSELYKRRQLIRQYIIDWDNYTEEEKIQIIRGNNFTTEEIEIVNKIRIQINKTIDEVKKK